MEGIFTKLDELIASFMSGIFDGINNFWNEIFAGAGTGAYISVLLVGVFLAILMLIGLFKFLKKFGLLLILIIITVGIPCVWFLFVK